MGLEDDFLLADADDEKTIEFIKNYLPQELKEKFSDDELYYFLDLIDEYYSESGILDAQPDEDGYVDIDLEEVVAYIVKEAKRMNGRIRSRRSPLCGSGRNGIRRLSGTSGLERGVRSHSG